MSNQGVYKLEERYLAIDKSPNGHYGCEVEYMFVDGVLCFTDIRFTHKGYYINEEEMQENPFE